jgi:hypothetical protein
MFENERDPQVLDLLADQELYPTPETHPVGTIFSMFLEMNGTGTKVPGDMEILSWTNSPDPLWDVETAAIVNGERVSQQWFPSKKIGVIS